MAKVELNAALAGLRGRLDGAVFRQLYGRIVMSRRPHRERAPSAREAQQIDRFRLAALRARAAPPEMCERYKQRARVENRPAFAVRVRDYLNAPIIDSINLAGYTGRPGQSILVRARDDFEVKAVMIVLRLPNGAELETGPARRVEGDDQLFHYVTVCAPAAGTEIVVETSEPTGRAT